METNMPDPKFSKPWHGVPREQIQWNPTVIEDVCIGCGTCVTGCNRLVYRFDYTRKKPVVADPLNCMVGCTTCANTCPTHAIHFPPLSTVFAMEARAEVRHVIEDDLIARREQLAWHDEIPHPDRLVELAVENIERPNPSTLLVRLAPKVKGECFCQFAPGQYVEVWVPDTPYLSRSYSIGNTPREDGSIDLQIRHVEGGRLSEWAFNRMKVGDHVHARGPLGTFTMRSPIDRPLLFIAGGTGFAPIEALIEQQLKLSPQRDMVLVWGVGDARDFYALDTLEDWSLADKNLRILLAAQRGLDTYTLPAGITTITNSVIDALHAPGLALAGRDAYVAGPPVMMPAVVAALAQEGIDHERIRVDSFGL
ncbi:FAD-binding oxidoreductase [Stutzerimonas kunmingensis]|uniref:FAD-binding oxidoreductase n=1 Tax=Stutzerimonas kunmingensis TaxID=1211807 RepID=UPI002107B017|nr:FAD-binding oxidoreductase [Stutzerimonas kunmingensis]MCQ2036328.1 FAD-binding oxidoreductase [Stutzerimonas kunmingensis]